MKWVLITLCSVLGAFSMPYHESGDQSLDKKETQGSHDKEYFTGFIPLIRDFPELLYNSEASPALPTGTRTSSGFKSSSVTDSNLLVTAPKAWETLSATSPPPTMSTITSTTSTSTTTTTLEPKFREDNHVGSGATSAASSRSTFLLPIQNPDPSIQFLPPEALPTTPTTTSPKNIHDIPLSLVSLSGNSGAITSEEEIASPSNQDIPEQMGVDFTKFRYHVETGKLVKIGSTGEGICPKNMRFFAVPGHPKNGGCDCDYYQCSRPLIYSPDKHQCFWAWSQGPCQEGEWFVFNRDLRKRGSCEKRACPSDLKTDNNANNNTTIKLNTSSEYFFLNPDDDTCYEAGTQGNCKEDERLLIFPMEPIPKCRKFTLCYPLTVPQEMQCIFGSKYFVESGHC